MILVDSGPLVALFDPADPQHAHCGRRLESAEEPLATTVPVLTQVFTLLGPASLGSDRLRDFILQGGLSVWFFDAPAMVRTFDLMEAYADQGMNLADASLMVAAERLGTRKVFTLGGHDFNVYRVKIGPWYHPLEAW